MSGTHLVAKVKSQRVESVWLVLDYELPSVPQDNVATAIPEPVTTRADQRLASFSLGNKVWQTGAVPIESGIHRVIHDRFHQ